MHRLASQFAVNLQEMTTSEKPVGVLHVPEIVEPASVAVQLEPYPPEKLTVVPLTDPRYVPSSQ